MINSDENNKNEVPEGDPENVRADGTDDQIIDRENEVDDEEELIGPLTGAEQYDEIYDLPDTDDEDANERYEWYSVPPSPVPSFNVGMSGNFDDGTFDDGINVTELASNMDNIAIEQSTDPMNDDRNGIGLCQLVYLESLAKLQHQTTIDVQVPVQKKHN